MKRKEALLAFLFLLVGFLWARDLPMTSGTVDPGARGKLTVDKQNLKVEVQHLAPASALTPPKMGYVVWIQPPDHPPENHGVFKVNKGEKGSFETTTAYPRYDVFVTAEDNPQTTVPSGPEVLRASVAPES